MLGRINLNILRLLRFGLVGSLGTVINFTIYYGFMKFSTLGINISSIAAFFVAVINNYVINHRWTFASENEDNPINLTQFIYYLLGNLVGLFINLLTLNIFVEIAGINFHLIAQLTGIAFGMIFNFFFVKEIIFAKISKKVRNINN